MPNYNSGTPSPAIPVSWTETISGGHVTAIKKAHTDELRAALTALDGHIHAFNSANGYHNSQAELPNVSVSYAEAITVGLATKAQHINELADYVKAFDAHYHQIPNYDDNHATTKNSTTYDPTISITDDPKVANVTDIKAVHYNELRTYLEGFSTHIHSACCECECTCTCTCQCQGNCGCTCNCTCTCKTC